MSPRSQTGCQVLDPQAAGAQNKAETVRGVSKSRLCCHWSVISEPLPWASTLLTCSGPDKNRPLSTECWLPPSCQKSCFQSRREETGGFVHTVRDCSCIVSTTHLHPSGSKQLLPQRRPLGPGSRPPAPDHRELLLILRLL